MTLSSAWSAKRVTDFGERSSGKVLRPTRDSYGHTGAAEVVVDGERSHYLAAAGPMQRLDHDGRATFGWGYPGGGPDDLALAILNELGVTDPKVVHNCHVGMLGFVSDRRLSRGSWTLDLGEVGRRLDEALPDGLDARTSMNTLTNALISGFDLQTRPPVLQVERGTGQTLTF